MRKMLKALLVLALLAGSATVGQLGAMDSVEVKKFTIALEMNSDIDTVGEVVKALSEWYGVPIYISTTDVNGQVFLVSCVSFEECYVGNGSIIIEME